MARTAVIIEDNPNNARLAEKLLKRGAFEVHIAEDGESGYDLALENQPDIILIDLGLPDMDGQTVAAMLRQDTNMQATPIIAFTAWPQETAEEMAAAYGCDGVIVKPIDTRTFLQQIEAFIANKAKSE